MILYFEKYGNMKTQSALAALAALAQETRLAVFRYLVEAGPEGVTVGRIGETLEVAPATLSFHLKELSRAGLVASRQESRFIWYSANYTAMNGLVAYLTENCCRGQPAACGVACTPKAKPVAGGRASKLVKASGVGGK
ncbi:MAG: transcriptional regulator [Nevskia sp.]|nr:transcriptional regulator [Nevskia sp.]